MIGVGIAAVVLVWLQAGQIADLLELNHSQSQSLQEMQIELKRAHVDE